MAGLLLANSAASAAKVPCGSVIRRIGILGLGEVVQRKFWPAVQGNGYDLDGIAVCSLEAGDPLKGPPHLYRRVDPGHLPLDYLEAEGFLSGEVLWYVATPSDCHVDHAIGLARHSRVAIEKPLAANAAQARLLLPFAGNGFEVLPIDHKLFNASALAFVDTCRQNPSVLSGVRHIEGRFFETSGFSHGRQQEDCIADVQHHLLVPIEAAFKSAGEWPEMTIDNAWVATHKPDTGGRFATPRFWTASRLEGRVLRNGHPVAFDLLQAKGAPENQKSIRFHDRHGALVAAIDLNETGWQAHARVLAELLKPQPDMRYDLADAIAVMELIDRSRAMAVEEPPYPFGGLPGFLSGRDVGR